MSIIQNFKTEILKSGFRGVVHDDYATRLLNATDNSIYELMPDAVIQPQDFADLKLLLDVANQDLFRELCFTARGGGTGTNGQSLSKSIIIDFSRFMTKISAFNPEARTIMVEPGVILSDLNRFLAPHGLFFAPNVSTADRATIGGMIATDAAGKGSLIYGKTIDSLVSVKVILANGDVIDTEKMAVEKINDLENNISKQLYTQIIALLNPVQEEIQRIFPPLKRQLSGYNIKQCYKDGYFDLTPLIAGSEGTLGLVASATLKLLPIPKHKVLMVVHYSSFLEALKDAENLVKYKPLAIEAIDEKVQQSAQTLPNWPVLAKLLNSEGKTYISNFIEFVADNINELNNTVDIVKHDLDKRNANYVVITDNNQINQLWSIRSLAVGLAGKMPGVRKPVAFVEDAIVPPENLASFVADLQEMLDADGLNYAMYGHVDVGCIHVRPALNMQDTSDQAKIRPITLGMIKLLNKYHGVLWGEHGKGFRGEFVPDVFGPVLYPVLCKIKALLDPHNRLNPGKLSAPKADIALTRIEKVTMRGQLDTVIDAENQKDFAGAMLCNGNAACFNKDSSNVMCPSYKVTKDRIHSPKGRAMLVKEWLRAKANKSPDTKQIAKMTYDAMSGCLGCKGCSGKCPTQVSIPDLRTQFLDSYHTKYKRRSLRELALGNIEGILPIAAKFPRLWNFVHRYKLVPSFGLNNIPLFKVSRSLVSVLNELDVKFYSTPSQVTTLDKKAVVIFADVFTGFLDNQVLRSSITVFKKLGFKPYVIYPRTSGKALIVGGFIARFRKNAGKLSKLLTPLFEANIPVIGLENTITLMFRDEVSKFARPFVGRVVTLAEFLSNQENLSTLKSSEINKYRLLPHCTEQAILPGEATLWKKVFASVGLSLDLQNAGCCGMAGHYGYLKEHQEHSQELFAMHWQKPLEVANNNEEKVLATGFSCRCQTLKEANMVIAHPIEILSKA